MDPFEFWSPFIKTARANLTAHRFPDDISPAWIERNLAAMHCSPYYPQAVAHNVMVARELCVAGCLFYELYTASIQHSASALEAALKERFVALLPIPCRLTKSQGGKITDEKTWTARPSVDEFVHAVSEGWKLPPPFGRFRPTLGSLLRWGEVRGLIPADRDSWFQYRLRLRNIIAHGYNMVVAPSFALATLQETTLTLNQLYPHPETSAYDEQMRKEREDRLREWWLEVADMHRSTEDIREGDPDSDTNEDE